MKEICTDLAKECEELDSIVTALDESGWNLMTAKRSPQCCTVRGLSAPHRHESDIHCPFFGKLLNGYSYHTFILWD